MLQAESAADGFWNNLEKAQKVQQRIKVLQTKVDSQRKRKQQWDDLMALCEMGNEFEDESLIPELEEGLRRPAGGGGGPDPQALQGLRHAGHPHLHLYQQNGPGDPGSPGAVRGGGTGAGHRHLSRQLAHRLRQGVPGRL